MSAYPDHPPSPQRRWKPEPIERPVLPPSLKNRRGALELQENDVEELAERLETRMGSILAGYTQLNEMAVNIPDSLEGFANELSGCARKIASDAINLGLDEKHISSASEFSRLDLENAYRSMREAHGSHINLSRDLHFQNEMHRPSTRLPDKIAGNIRLVPSSHMSKQNRVVNSRRDQKEESVAATTKDGFIPIPSFRSKKESNAENESKNNDPTSKHSETEQPGADSHKSNVKHSVTLGRASRSKSQSQGARVTVAFGGAFRGDEQVTNKKSTTKKRKVKRLKKRSSSKENLPSSEPTKIDTQIETEQTDACLRQHSANWVIRPPSPEPSPPSPPPSGPSERTIYRVLPVSAHLVREKVVVSGYDQELHIEVPPTSQPSSATSIPSHASSNTSQRDKKKKETCPSSRSSHGDSEGFSSSVKSRYSVTSSKASVNHDDENEESEEKNGIEAYGVHFDGNGCNTGESTDLVEEYFRGDQVVVERSACPRLMLGEGMLIYAAGGDQVEESLAETSHEETPSLNRKAPQPHSPGYNLVQLRGEGRASTPANSDQPIVTKLFKAIDTEKDHLIDIDCADEMVGEPSCSQEREQESRVSEDMSERELHTLTLIILANIAEEMQRNKQASSKSRHTTSLTSLSIRAPIPQSTNQRAITSPGMEPEEEEEEEDEPSDLAALVRCLVSEQRQNLALQKELLQHIQKENKVTTLSSAPIANTPLSRPQLTFNTSQVDPLSSTARSIESEGGLQTLNSIDFRDTSVASSSAFFHPLAPSARPGDGEGDGDYSVDGDHEEGLGEVVPAASNPSAAPSQSTTGQHSDRKNFNSNWGHLLHEGPNYHPPLNISESVDNDDEPIPPVV